METIGKFSYAGPTLQPSKLRRQSFLTMGCESFPTWEIVLQFGRIINKASSSGYTPKAQRSSQVDLCAGKMKLYPSRVGLSVFWGYPFSGDEKEATVLAGPVKEDKPSAAGQEGDQKYSRRCDPLLFASGPQQRLRRT